MKISRSTYYYQSKKKSKTGNCVYLSIDSNEVIFYVGAGSLPDALSPYNKGRNWTKIAKKGYYTKIIKRDMDLKSAIYYRDSLIKEYGLIKDGGTLVNEIRIKERRRVNMSAILDIETVIAVRNKIKDIDYSNYNKSRSKFYKEFQAYPLDRVFHMKKFGDDVGLSLPTVAKYVEEVYKLSGFER